MGGECRVNGHIRNANYMDTHSESSTNNKTKGWLKKGGILVFLFFLLKGIGWLILMAALAFGFMNEDAIQKLREVLPFL